MSYPIVLACDEAYAMPMTTALRSIVEANQSAWPLDFHVLDAGLSEETKSRVLHSLPLGSASIRWVAVDLEFAHGLSTIDRISKATYSRLLIPDVFPDTVSRVLYVDADILVLDDLEPLWRTHLEGAVLGAVLDRWDFLIKRNKPGLEAVPRVGHYFNAGVLLIDLDRWRREHISQKALEYLARHPDSPFSDQDALNFACDGLWKRLEPRWNFHEIGDRRITEIDPHHMPAILHFVTGKKPWKAESANAAFYDAFRSRTKFARTRWDKVCDARQVVWVSLKMALKRYAIVRTIRAKVGLCRLL